MSSNSLLASLYGHNNNSPSSRSSSLFTKQLSFMPNLLADNKKARPVSVSKIIQNSKCNNGKDLVKLTPLIKSVNKLSSKIKRQYFYFWCKMQTYLKTKDYVLKDQNKQNNRRKSNQGIAEQKQNKCLIEKIYQQKLQIVNRLDKPLINNCQNTQFSNSIIDIKSSDDLVASQLEKIQHSNLQKNSICQLLNPTSFHCQQSIKEQQQKNFKEKSSINNNQNKLKHLQNLFIIISKIYYTQIGVNLKKLAFRNILSKVRKHKSIQILGNLELKRNDKIVLSEIFKTINKISNRFIKMQFLLCLLADLKEKKLKLGFKELINKSKQIKLSLVNKNIRLQQQLKKLQSLQGSNQSCTLNGQQHQKFKQQKELKQFVSVKKQRANYERIIHLQNVKSHPISKDKFIKQHHLPAYSIECQQQLQTTQIKHNQKVEKSDSIRPLSINLTQRISDNISIHSMPLQIMSLKPLEFTCHQKQKGLSFKIKNSIVQDRLIQHMKFKCQNSNERMKKLSRLHAQQPSFQIPDIADITLFNEVIKNQTIMHIHDVCNQLKRQQNCSPSDYNSNIKTQLAYEKTFQSCKSQTDSKKTLRMITPSKKQYQKQKNNTNKSNQNHFKIQLQASPKFKQASLQNHSNFKNQVQIKKSSSYSNIQLIRKSASKGMHTSGSQKKPVQLFGKKQSVQLTSNLHTTKSSLLKRFQLNNKAKPIESDKKKDLSSTKHLKQKQLNTQQSKFTDPNNIENNIVSQKLNFNKMQSQIHNKNSCKQLKNHSAHQSNNNSTSKKTNKQNVNSSQKKSLINYSYKKTDKQNISISQLKKSISKKQIAKSKLHTQLSQFSVPPNTKGSLHNNNSKQVIIYLSSQFNTLSSRNPLEQKDMNANDNQHAFQRIQMTEPNQYEQQICKYDFCSAQLTRQKGQTNAKSSSKKLRSKLDKIQLNTARKMKLQIENMINQRKKSSLGLLKY